MGSDLKFVRDGKAVLRVVEVRSQRARDVKAEVGRSPGWRRVVVNVEENQNSPSSTTGETDVTTSAVLPQLDTTAHAITPVKGCKLVLGCVISGRGVEMVKGRKGVATLTVREGLWEQRRGRKVDGGERRKAMVRAKRRMEERRSR